MSHYFACPFDVLVVASQASLFVRMHYLCFFCFLIKSTFYLYDKCIKKWVLLYVQDILSTSASRPIQNPVSAPANPGTRHNIPQRAYSSSHIQNHYQRLHEGSEQSMPEPSSNGSDERDGGRQERIDDVRSQQPHVAEKRPVSVERIDPVVSWLELETEGFYLPSI